EAPERPVHLEIRMLDPASVPQPKPATSPASSGSARHAAKDEAGFHGRLREALESPQGEEQPGRSGLEASSANRRDDDRLAQRAKSSEPAKPEVGSPAPGAVEGQAQAKNDASAGAATPQLEAPVLPEGADAAPAEVLLTELEAIEGALGQAAPLTPDLAASSVVPQPTASLVTQAALGLSDGPEASHAPGVAAAAHPNTQIEGEAAEQLRSQMMAAQQSAASGGAAAATTDQQQNVANALASGPTQAAAAQAVPPPQQALGGASKSAPPAPRDDTVEATKPAEPLSLLAKALSNIEAAAEMKVVAATETAEAGLRLASVEAPKAASTKPSGEMRAEGLSMLPQGFAATDALALRAEAPLSSAPTRELATPMPARQLAPVVVSLALGRGDEALTIALDPVELGRVEVSIGQGKEAGQVRIVAERPETLALLQRDQRELDRALNQAGLGDMARSLSFSLASDQGRQQQYGAQDRGQRRASFAIGGVEGEAAMPGLPAPLRNATSLIDIAV
ncbi:MAG: flagellar hook-length control protein FliK, partial [Acetobacteraceae bacterium]